MWCKNKIKFLEKKNILECLWLLLDSICGKKKFCYFNCKTDGVCINEKHARYVSKNATYI